MTVPPRNEIHAGGVLLEEGIQRPLPAACGPLLGDPEPTLKKFGTSDGMSGETDDLRQVCQARVGPVSDVVRGCESVRVRGYDFGYPDTLRLSHPRTLHQETSRSRKHLW